MAAMCKKKRKRAVCVSLREVFTAEAQHFFSCSRPARPFVFLLLFNAWGTKLSHRPPACHCCRRLSRRTFLFRFLSLLFSHACSSTFLLPSRMFTLTPLEEHFLFCFHFPFLLLTLTSERYRGHRRGMVGRRRYYGILV